MKLFKSGAFVRLSTRSPKDAALSLSRTESLWQEELSKIGDDQKESDMLHENARLIALIISSTRALKVSSGKEAMQLIQISERSNEDLLSALEFPNTWDMKIIIREWIDIHPSMEFRGFVYKRRFTALSQYFHFVYFRELVDKKSAVLDQIQKCFQQVQPLIPVDSYIIDFAVIGSRVLVIELNPEGCGTDPALFSWKMDREILDGRAPFEFRIREKAFDVKLGIMTEWREKVKVPERV